MARLLLIFGLSFCMLGMGTCGRRRFVYVVEYEFKVTPCASSINLPEQNKVVGRYFIQPQFENEGYSRLYIVYPKGLPNWKKYKAVGLSKELAEKNFSYSFEVAKVIDNCTLKVRSWARYGNPSILPDDLVPFFAKGLSTDDLLIEPTPLSKRKVSEDEEDWTYSWFTKVL